MSLIRLDLVGGDPARIPIYNSISRFWGPILSNVPSADAARPMLLELHSGVGEEQSWSTSSREESVCFLTVSLYGGCISTAMLDRIGPFVTRKSWGQEVERQAHT